MAKTRHDSKGKRKSTQDAEPERNDAKTLKKAGFSASEFADTDSNDSVDVGLHQKHKKNVTNKQNENKSPRQEQSHTPTPTVSRLKLKLKLPPVHSPKGQFSNFPLPPIGDAHKMKKLIPYVADSSEEDFELHDSEIDDTDDTDDDIVDTDDAEETEEDNALKRNNAVKKATMQAVQPIIKALVKKGRALKRKCSTQDDVSEDVQPEKVPKKGKKLKKILNAKDRQQEAAMGDTTEQVQVEGGEQVDVSEDVQPENVQPKKVSKKGKKLKKNLNAEDRQQEAPMGETTEQVQEEGGEQHGLESIQEEDILEHNEVLECQRNEEDGQRTVVAKRKRNTMGRRRGNLETRTVPQKFVQTVKEMSEDKKNCIRDMGFGHLLDLNITDVPHSLGFWLVDHFDPVRCELIMANGHAIHITDADVRKVLGIPLGNEAIKRRTKKDDTTILSQWKSFYGGDTVVVRPTTVATKLKECETTDKWFKMNFIVYFITLLVESTGNGSANEKWVIDNVDNYPVMNWCGLVMSALVDSAQKWKKKRAGMFTGPILFLTLFYVDRVSILGEMPPTAFPVFLAWGDGQLTERQQKEDKLGGFGLGHMLDRGVSTTPEGPQPAVNSIKEQGCGSQATPQQPENLMDSLLVLANKIKKAATSIVELADYIDTINQEYKQEEMFKQMYEAGKSLIGMAEGTQERLDETREFETIWNQSQHPFWNDPQLLECLNELEKAKTSKERMRRPGSFTPPSFDIFKNLQEGATTTLVDEVGGTDEVVHQVHVDKGKDKPRGTDGIQHQDIENQVDMAKRKDKGKGKVNADETHEVHNEGDMARGRDKVKGKGKENQAVVFEEELPEKRKTRLADTQRSPYFRRKIVIAERMTEDQNQIWDYIMNTELSDVMNVVFKFKTLIVDKNTFSSMDQDMDADVINVWSTYLNQGEQRKSKDKPSRLFGSVFINSVGLNENQFETMIETALHVVDGRQMKDIDMVFIPVIFDSRYFVITFNLKANTILILDSYSSNGTMEDKYEDIPQTLRDLMYKYLKTKKLHKKANALQSMNLCPSLVDMQGATTTQASDIGLYAMRSMETYMGVQEWHHGLSPRNDTKTSILRKKFVHAMLTSTINEVSDQVKKWAKKYKEDSKRKKK